MSEVKKFVVVLLEFGLQYLSDGFIIVIAFSGSVAVLQSSLLLFAVGSVIPWDALSKEEEEEEDELLPPCHIINCSNSVLSIVGISFLCCYCYW